MSEISVRYLLIFSLVQQGGASFRGSPMKRIISNVPECTKQLREGYTEDRLGVSVAVVVMKTLGVEGAERRPNEVNLV